MLFIKLQSLFGFHQFSTVVLSWSQDLTMHLVVMSPSFLQSSIISQSFLVFYDLSRVLWKVLIWYFAEWVLVSRPSVWVYMIFSYDHIKFIHFGQECHRIDVLFSVSHTRGTWCWSVTHEFLMFWGISR